jgi:AcrR family transcriptional regulator
MGQNTKTDNRLKFIDTARKLFQTKGYENTSVREICNEARLSNGTFYYYFKSKRELLAAVCDSGANVYNLLEDCEEKAKDPLFHLSVYFVSYAGYWNELGIELTTQAYRIYDKLFLNPDLSKKQIDSRDMVSGFIRVAQNTGTFDDSISAEEAADYLFTMARGLLYEWILRKGNFDMVGTAGRYVTRVLKPFVDGF